VRTVGCVDSAILEVWRDTGLELVQLEGRRITVGRSVGNTIVLGDERFASRTHAMFEPVAGGWKVRDFNSRNGTFLNGARIAPLGEIRLGDGDEVRIGGTCIVLRLPPADADVVARR
jgi:pSer/pThr/pTyr-binding forkhead associated (FHA) protein